MGTLHDHVINFKVDLDVVNKMNSLMEQTTHVREVSFPWSDDEDWGTTTKQQFIKSRYIETEDESKLFYPPNFRGLFAFVNKDERNSWGVPRGYLIHPGYSPVHNVRLGIIRFLYIAVQIGKFPFILFADCRWIKTHAEQCQLCEI